MTLLTADDYALLTADWGEMFPDTGQIIRVAASADGLGGRTVTWDTIYDGPCRVAPARNDVDEAQDGGRMRDEMLFRFAFPAGTDVTFVDRVVWRGETFTISSVRAPHSLEMERVAYGERAPK